MATSMCTTQADPKRKVFPCVPGRLLKLLNSYHVTRLHGFLPERDLLIFQNSRLMNSSSSWYWSYYLAVYLWLYYPDAHRKMNDPSWLRKWGSAIFSMLGFMDSRIKSFLNNVKRVLFIDLCLFSTPPFLKNSAFFNQQHRYAPLEMVCFSACTGMFP